MGYSWSRQDASVGAGFLRIATEQMAKAVLNADAVGNPPAERIHAARRHCKRLRGLFRVVRPDFGAYAEANAAVREAAAVLSAARDARVVSKTLEELYQWAGQRPPALSAARNVAPEGEEKALTAFRGAISQLMVDAASWKVGRMNRRTIGRGVRHCYEAAAQAAAETRKQSEDEAFHAWRKLAKYHSFHLVLLRAPLADEARTNIERAERLAEALGRHHDLALLLDTARRHPARLADDLDLSFVALHCRQQQERLAAEAFRLGDDIFARPARMVQESVETRWRTWRAETLEIEPA